MQIKAQNANKSYLHNFEISNHDLSWLVMAFHDLSWPIMTFHDFSWHIITFHGFSWHIITYHDTSWLFMTFHKIYHNISWHFMTFHIISWQFMTFQDFSRLPEKKQAPWTRHKALFMTPGTLHLTPDTWLNPEGFI